MQLCVKPKCPMWLSVLSPFSRLWGNDSRSRFTLSIRHRNMLWRVSIGRQKTKHFLSITFKIVFCAIVMRVFPEETVLKPWAAQPHGNFMVIILQKGKFRQ